MIKTHWNKDTTLAILEDPQRAVNTALKIIQDDYVLFDALRSDLDFHSIIATKILGKKRVSREERDTCKVYTFKMRYGAFKDVPTKIQKRYQKLFPNLMVVGEQVRRRVLSNRAAAQKRMELAGEYHNRKAKGDL